MKSVKLVNALGINPRIDHFVSYPVMQQLSSLYHVWDTVCGKIYEALREEMEKTE